MSQPTGIIRATAKDVLDLLKQVESHWPIHESHSTYRSWHSKAHKAVSEGLMTLSCSTWTYNDRAEEAKERQFPADEFNELKDCLVHSLSPVQLAGILKMPVIEEFTVQACEEIIEEAGDDHDSTAVHTPCALVNIPLQLIKLSKDRCATSNYGNERYSVGEYVRIVESSGWQAFRRYLFNSLKLYWTFATVLQSYEVLSDILAIQSDTESGGYEPVQLYRILEKDFDLAHREGQEKPLKEDTQDKLRYLHFSTALYNVYRSDKLDFPALEPTLHRGRRGAQFNTYENEPVPEFSNLNPFATSRPLRQAESSRRSRSRSRSRSPRSANARYRQRDYREVESVRSRSRSPSRSQSPPGMPLTLRPRSLAHLSQRKQTIYTDLV